MIDADGRADVNSVNVDARSGCRSAAQHLLDLGHRRFAIMSFLRDLGPPAVHAPKRGRGLEVAGMPLDQQKLHGYAEALTGAGINIDDVPMIQAHPWDRTAAALLLDEFRSATAVLAMADLQALSVIEEARRRGLNVPSDISVIGFNNIPEAAAANLTTIDSNGAEKGRVAARLVFSRWTSPSRNPADAPRRARHHRRCPATRILEWKIPLTRSSGPGLMAAFCAKGTAQVDLTRTSQKSV